MSKYVILKKPTELLIGEFITRFNGKFTRKNDKDAIKPIQATLLQMLTRCLAAQLNRHFENGLSLTSEAALSLTHFHSYYKKNAENTMNVTKQTVNNYLRILKNAGALVCAKAGNRTVIFLHPDLVRFNDKFEVLISCSLCHFFGQDPATLKKIQKPDLQPLFFTKGGKFIPESSSGTIKRQIESVVENPQRGNTSEGKPQLQENTTQGQPVQTYLETRKTAEKKEENQAPAPKNVKEYSEIRRQTIRNKHQETRAGLVNRLVVFLWSFVIENFYRPQYEMFSESQEQIVLRFFHDQFETVPDHRIHEVHAQLHERNKRWLKFLKKDPERFTPLPGKFFDLRNTRGYQITKAWIQQDSKQIKEYSAKNEIDHQLRKAKNLLFGSATYKGKYLTQQERWYYLNQINDEVDSIAQKYNSQDLKVTYQRRLTEAIEKAGINQGMN